MTKQVPLAIILHDSWKDSDVQFWQDYLVDVMKFSLLDSLAIIMEYREFYSHR